MQHSLLRQREAHRYLKEIEELLPRQAPQQQPSPHPQQSEEPQPPQQESPQEQEPDASQGDLQPPEEEPPQEAEPGEDQEQKPPEDVAKLLERALQREKEHEAEKRRRAEKIPISPFERDW
jgi:hypothetical protein